MFLVPTLGGFFMALNIKIDKKYYKADTISNGRIIRAFFERLTQNVFEQSYSYWKNYYEIMKETGHLPILYTERNLYSTFAAAVDKITPIHLSEYSFNQNACKDLTSNNQRRVDLWCLNREGNSGTPLNYFIEIKKGSYCLNGNTRPDFRQDIYEDVANLITQIRDIRAIKPNWGTDNVFLGLYVIQGYYREGKEYYDHEQVRENIYNQIDQRSKFQLIMSTWTLGNEMDISWGNEDKCKFISIAGIVSSSPIRA
jgi:hypothetical protein